MNANIIFRLSLALPLLALGSGCATKAVWNGDVLNQWNGPARTPDLRLYQAARHDDYLVVYNELSERRDVVRPRAYFLRENQDRINHNQAPKFVDQNYAAGLPAVPLFFSTNAPALTLPPFPRAVLATNEQSFNLVSSGQFVGLYSLPVYKEGFDTAERVAIMPLAAVADLSIVGGLVVYWTMPAAAQAAASYVNK